MNTSNSNITWFFSPIKWTDTSGVLLADNLQYCCSKTRVPIQPLLTVFFPRIAVLRISSVVCFLGPLGLH